MIGRTNLNIPLVTTFFLLGMIDTIFASQIITVDDDGPADFDKIQTAIDYSNDGDTIVVTAGHYYENINLGGKNIILSSADPDDAHLVSTTIIDGAGVGRTVTFSGSERFDCVLMGFTITGGYVSGDGGGIFGNFSHATITNCVIKDNTAGNGGGGIAKFRGTIRNCIISNNSSQFGGGLYRAHGNIVNCTVAFNAGGGLNHCYGSTTNCIIWGNSGQQIYSSNNPTYSCVQGGAGGNGNISGNPGFISSDNFHLTGSSPCIDAGTNTPPGGLFPDLEGYPRPLDGNNNGTAVADMGAYEKTVQTLLLSTDSVFVPEGGTATFTVSLLLAPQGIVEATVHRESGDTDIMVQSGSSITFDSSNYWIAQPVTLAAAQDDDSVNGQASIVVSAAGLSVVSVPAIELDNAIPNVIYVDSLATGDASGSSWANAFTNLQEALSLAGDFPQVDKILVAEGVYKPTGMGGDRNASFHLINGLAIKGGYAGFGEPDPNARDIAAHETILSGDLNSNDNGFSGNGENSFQVVNGSGTDNTAILDGFTITSGNANGSAPKNYGAGMYNSGGSPMLINCIFHTNEAYYRGGGMHNKGAKPTLINCRFINNLAMVAGGMCNDWSNTNMTNCMFVRNSAWHFGGGGMYNTHSDPVLINCTFSGNVSTSTYYVGRGAGIRNNSSVPRLTNCILWGNIDSEGMDQVAQLDGGRVNHSCIQGWAGSLGGTGNIGEDPLFVDMNDPGPNGQGFHLLPDSNCIDVGDPSSDFSLEPEPDGGRINMGAYGNTREATCKYGLVLESYSIISKARVERAVFDYVGKMTLTNNSFDPVRSVLVELLDAPSNISVLDDNVSFAYIGAGKSAISEDTFTLRVDRSAIIDAAIISWRALVNWENGERFAQEVFKTSITFEPVRCELTGDSIVDIEDVARLASQWLWVGPSGSIPEDISEDGTVNLADFAELAQDWLE